jgi:hypothetical protein
MSPDEGRVPPENLSGFTGNGVEHSQGHQGTGLMNFNHIIIGTQPMKPSDEGSHATGVPSANDDQRNQGCQDNDFIRNVAMMAVTQQTDAAIAQYVVIICFNEYCCDGNGTWYHFEDHHWKKVNDRHMCHSIMTSLFNHITSFCALNNHTLTDETLAILLLNLKNKLETMNIAESICRTVAMLLERWKPFNEFKAKLDTNPNLRCFKNGVYDSELRQLRDGKPDDYISIQEPFEHVENSNQKQVTQILEQHQYLCQRFLEECCIVDGKSESRIHTADLFRIFQEWVAKQISQAEVSQTAMSAWFRERSAALGFKYKESLRVERAVCATAEGPNSKVSTGFTGIRMKEWDCKCRCLERRGRRV